MIMGELRRNKAKGEELISPEYAEKASILNTG